MPPSLAESESRHGGNPRGSRRASEVSAASNGTAQSFDSEDTNKPGGGGLRGNSSDYNQEDTDPFSQLRLDTQECPKAATSAGSTSWNPITAIWNWFRASGAVQARVHSDPYQVLGDAPSGITIQLARTGEGLSIGAQIDKWIEDLAYQVESQPGGLQTRSLSPRPRSSSIPQGNSSSQASGSGSGRLDQEKEDGDRYQVANPSPRNPGLSSGSRNTSRLPRNDGSPGISSLRAPREIMDEPSNNPQSSPSLGPVRSSPHNRQDSTSLEGLSPIRAGTGGHGNISERSPSRKSNNSGIYRAGRADMDDFNANETDDENDEENELELPAHRQSSGRVNTVEDEDTMPSSAPGQNNSDDQGYEDDISSRSPYPGHDRTVSASSPLYRTGGRYLPRPITMRPSPPTPAARKTKAVEDSSDEEYDPESEEDDDDDESTISEFSEVTKKRKSMSSSKLAKKRKSRRDNDDDDEEDEESDNESISSGSSNATVRPLHRRNYKDGDDPAPCAPGSEGNPHADSDEQPDQTTPPRKSGGSSRQNQHSYIGGLDGTDERGEDSRRPPQKSSSWGKKPDKPVRSAPNFRQRDEDGYLPTMASDRSRNSSGFPLENSPRSRDRRSESPDSETEIRKEIREEEDYSRRMPRPAPPPEDRRNPLTGSSPRQHFGMSNQVPTHKNTKHATKSAGDSMVPMDPDDSRDSGEGASFSLPHRSIHPNTQQAAPRPRVRDVHGSFSGMTVDSGRGHPEIQASASDTPNPGPSTLISGGNESARTWRKKPSKVSHLSPAAQGPAQPQMMISNQPSRSRVEPAQYQPHRPNYPAQVNANLLSDPFFRSRQSPNTRNAAPHEQHQEMTDDNPIPEPSQSQQSTHTTFQPPTTSTSNVQSNNSRDQDQEMTAAPRKKNMARRGRRSGRGGGK